MAASVQAKYWLCSLSVLIWAVVVMPFEKTPESLELFSFQSAGKCVEKLRALSVGGDCQERVVSLHVDHGLRVDGEAGRVGQRFGQGCHLPAALSIPRFKYQFGRGRPAA